MWINKALHIIRCKTLRFNIYSDDFWIGDDWLNFIRAVLFYSSVLGLIILYLPNIKEWIS